MFHERAKCAGAKLIRLQDNAAQWDLGRVCQNRCVTDFEILLAALTTERCRDSSVKISFRLKILRWQKNVYALNYSHKKLFYYGPLLPDYCGSVYVHVLSQQKVFFICFK